MRPTPLLALFFLVPVAAQDTRAERDAETLADYQRARQSIDAGPAQLE